ncbi:MAG: hypothetical protein KC652_14360 [Cyanobacteria bacterium HKST-UBA01]|nr:hypothetical protein [Cyanobacteria bacterium HKST-UBA01]
MPDNIESAPSLHRGTEAAIVNSATEDTGSDRKQLDLLSLALDGAPPAEKKDSSTSSPIIGLDFDIDFGVLDNLDQGESGEKPDSPEAAAAERQREWFAERFLAVTGQESVIEKGPEAELNLWSDSWRDFVEVAEIPQGPFRDLMQEFGSEMLLGSFDGKQLAQKMKQIDDREEVEELVASLNDYDLKNYGAKLKVEFGEDGKLKTLELQSIGKEGKVDAYYQADSMGMVSAVGQDDEGKPLSQEDAVKKVARKASPLACP